MNKRTTDNNDKGSKMKATDFLRQAAERMDDRAREYDKPEGERSMKATVAAFNAITGRDLNESEGWLLIECLKNVRLFTSPGFHRDSAEDGIAYAALKAEALEGEREAPGLPLAIVTECGQAAAGPDVLTVTLAPASFGYAESKEQLRATGACRARSANTVCKECAVAGKCIKAQEAIAGGAGAAMPAGAGGAGN